MRCNERVAPDSDPPAKEESLMKNRFFCWLAGKPPVKKTFLRTVTGRVLTGMMWVYLFYTFLSGPGAVFASINPVGFRSVTAGNNVVHVTDAVAPRAAMAAPAEHCTPI